MNAVDGGSVKVMELALYTEIDEFIGKEDVNQLNMAQIGIRSSDGRRF